MSDTIPWWGYHVHMKISIRARHLDLTPELRDQLHRRIYFALGRFAPVLRNVAVMVTDINGPKGGPDKQCRIRVRGHGLPAIVIEQVGTDEVAVVALAAERAERAVVRAFARRRAFGPVLAT